MNGWEIVFWILAGWSAGAALFVISALCLSTRKGGAS